MSERKIVTSFVNPPIPARNWDWCAHYDGEEEAGNYGWGRAEQRLPAYAVERYGYAKARRIGVMAAVGGKDKTRIRNATPEPFRDLLLSIARGLPAQEQAA